MKFWVCVFVVFCCSPAFGQVPINGTCPKPCDTHLNVTVDQMVGLWFVRHSVPYPWEEGKCTYIQYTKISDTKLKFEKIIRDKE